MQDDDFDLDKLDAALAEFADKSVEGGFDADKDDDDGCAGGACKI